ncbi:MAG: M50 family metallopeptidase [Sphaerochaetaceae bacterium]|nr:M50 family metallopeptidase [Sphaerochaetaceae bacterium]
MKSLSLSWILSFIIGVLALDLIIIVHEMGHFIAARLCKIKVESLTFGIGPKLFSINFENTTITMKLIPFGGATVMAGQDDLKYAIMQKKRRLENCDEGSIYGVSPIKRIITYLAGPLMNIIFALFCFTILLLMPFMESYYAPKIGLASDHSEYYGITECAASKAGLLSGDTVYSINEIPVYEYNDIQNILKEHSHDSSVIFETDRGTFTVVPENGLFGIIPYEIDYRAVPGASFKDAVRLSFKECFANIRIFIDSVVSVVKGKAKMGDTLSGTIEASEQIGVISQNAFKADFNAGLRIVIYLAGTISVSLGVANMLPISALDGGLILISTVELITHRTFPPKVYIFLQVAGLLTILVIIPILRIYS